MTRGSKTPGRSRARIRNRIVAILGGLAVVSLLVTLAYVFSTSSGAEQVATNARALHRANASAGSTAIARASIAQAVVFSIDAELGVASVDARDLAINEAVNTLAETDRWIPDLLAEPETNAIGHRLDAFGDRADQIIQLLVAGESVEAEQLRQAELEPIYSDVADALAARQAEIIVDINTTERFAGVVGWLTRLLATLLIPAAAILLYFMLARRQVREAKVKMEARITAERQLGLAKDEFIAGISHELRTPLTSIYGFSEYLLENELLDPDEAMELLGLINNDSAELSRMVDDLLTAARIESDALSFTYDYVDIRGEAIAAMAPMMRAGAGVEVNGDLTTWADRVRVRQIVRNLVSNAIKHGGPDVGIYLEADGDRGVITVSDNGNGLTKEVEDRLFDRFVHDGGESLLMGSVGLGLSIARSLAQTMGGDIRFVRASGWTNFELSLPMTEDTVLELGTDQESGDSPDHAGAAPVLVSPT